MHIHISIHTFPGVRIRAYLIMSSKENGFVGVCKSESESESKNKKERKRKSERDREGKRGKEKESEEKRHI